MIAIIPFSVSKIQVSLIFRLISGVLSFPATPVGARIEFAPLPPHYPGASLGFSRSNCFLAQLSAGSIGWQSSSSTNVWASQSVHVAVKICAMPPRAATGTRDAGSLRRTWTNHSGWKYSRAVRQKRAGPPCPTLRRSTRRKTDSCTRPRSYSSAASSPFANLASASDASDSSLSGSGDSASSSCGSTCSPSPLFSSTSISGG